MKYLKKFEKTDHFNLNGDDDYDITKTIRDDGHNYQYCDGVLYELSGNDTIVNIDEVEQTDENMFYQEQIERYIQYFNDGGITQTFPVQSSPLGGCRNLDEMLEFLAENDNFDTAWDILGTLHKELFDEPLWEITTDPDSYGFSDDADLTLIHNEKDLDKYYNEDIMNDDDRTSDYNENYYLGFIAILKYWEDAKEYTLTDSNHRFQALKEMGKSQVMIDEYS